jgi:hypothetical protein
MDTVSEATVESVTSNSSTREEAAGAKSVAARLLLGETLAHESMFDSNLIKNLYSALT